MPKRYYLDTSIWIDMLEDRRGFNGEPLGEYAQKLISSIMAKGLRIVISENLINELEEYYSIEQINGMFILFEEFIDRIDTVQIQIDEAKEIAKTRNLPYGDAINAITARDNNLILVSRDNHFRLLADVSPFFKPEDLI